MYPELLAQRRQDRWVYDAGCGCMGRRSDMAGCWWRSYGGWAALRQLRLQRGQLRDDGSVFINYDLDPRMLGTVHKLTLAEPARYGRWPELG
jgi:hypothetical protein